MKLKNCFVKWSRDYGAHFYLEQTLLGNHFFCYFVKAVNLHIEDINIKELLEVTNRKMRIKRLISGKAMTNTDKNSNFKYNERAERVFIIFSGNCFFLLN